jgi:HEAT repeat protein
MAKSRKLEELQTRLNQIRAQLAEESLSELQPGTYEALLCELQQILTSKFAVAIAQAARIIRELDLPAATRPVLLDALGSAFDRLMQTPASSDPNCLGKKAIVDALYRLEYPETELFLTGIRHVQLEPVWGGQTDTAPGLRAICALGLVRLNYSEVMSELADLLADPESEARIGAARAIAYSENLQGVPLLRLKVQLGDDAPVLSECFAALLRLAPLSSLPLVERFLHASPQVGEMAALALGESRLPAALPLLKQWWQQGRDPELRQTGLLAIAMLRQPEAIEFLLGLISQPNPQDAEAAAVALGIYSDDQELMARMQALLAARAGRS